MGAHAEDTGSKGRRRSTGSKRSASSRNSKQSKGSEWSKGSKPRSKPEGEWAPVEALLRRQPHSVSSKEYSLHVVQNIPIHVLYMTAVPVEREAARRLLGPAPDRDHVIRTLSSGFTCYIGTIGGHTTVLVRSHDMGAVDAAVTVDNMIAEWQPRLLVTSGVAAALDPSLGLGDVMIAEQAVRVDLSKFTSSGEINKLDDPIPAGPMLLAKVADATADLDAWCKDVSRPDGSGCISVVKTTLAVQNSVIKDADVRDALRQRVPSARGSEMEAFGIHRGVLKRGITEWLMVKAVVDYADKKKDKRVQLFAALAAANVVHMVIARIAGTDLPVPAMQLVAVSTLPPRRVFLGRKADLKKFDTMVRSGAPVTAVTGIPGVGKSSIVLEFVQRLVDDGEVSVAIWIDVEQLETSLRAAAGRLGVLVSTLKTSEEVARAFRAALESSKQSWVVVFDNAEDPDSLAHALPQASHKRQFVLATSRNATWPNAHAVEPMSLEDAAALLKEEAGATPTEASEPESSEEQQRAYDALVRSLGMLPLSIRMFGRMMREEAISASEALQDLAGMLSDVARDERYAPVDYHEKQTMHAVVQRAMRSDDVPQLARDILRFASYLAPDRIPQVLLQKAVSPEPSLRVFRAAIAALRRRGLINYDGRDSLAVHRLVQDTVRGSADVLVSDVKPERVVAMVVDVMDGFSQSDSTTWPLATSMQPHILAVCHDVTGIAGAADAAALLNQYALILSDVQGLAKESLPVFLRALALAEKGVGKHSPRYLRLRQNVVMTKSLLGERDALLLQMLEDILAEIEEQLGKARQENKLPRSWHEEEEISPEAENLINLMIMEVSSRMQYAVNLLSFDRFSEAVTQADAVEKLLLEYKDVIPDSVRVSTATHRAVILSKVNRNAEGAEVLKEAVQLSTTVYGQDSVEPASLLLLLGQALLEAGQHEDALQVTQQAVDWSRRVRGDQHIETQMAVASLAAAHAAVGDRDTALREYQSARDGVMRVLNSDLHPVVLHLDDSIAALIEDLGRNEEALAMYKEMHPRFVKVFGSIHSQTLRIAMKNSASLFLLGRMDESEKLVREVLRVAQNLPADSPVLGEAEQFLATLLTALGRGEEAIEALTAGLARLEHSVGTSHPLYIYQICVIAKAYIGIGKVELAMEWAKRAYTAAKEELSLTHQATMVAVSMLLQLYLSLQDPGPGIELVQQYLDGIPNSSADAPDILVLRSSLAMARVKRASDGDFDAAAADSLAILDAFKRIGQSESLMAITAYQNCGVVLLSAQRSLEAVEILQEAEMKVSKMGAVTELTVQVRSNLCDCLMTLNRHDEALVVMELAWRDAQTVFAPGRPDRWTIGLNYAATLFLARRYDDAIKLAQQLLAELKSAPLPESNSQWLKQLLRRIVKDSKRERRRQRGGKCVVS